ncbi:MAG: FHA domain-containing protein [Candidatus Baltobacteraceae bacterium]
MTPAGAVAGFDWQMRAGSLAITVALGFVALLGARPRVRAAAEIGGLVPMRVDLEVLQPDGRHPHRGYPPFELGRAKQADLVLRDAEVSRRHARFASANGVVYVEDLKSSNGTFLNGRRVTEAIEVRGGDEIDVGTTRILVTAVEPR